MINFIKKIFNKKPYISEADQFLANFDQRCLKKSDSQMAEIAKHQRISTLRDQPISEYHTNNKHPASLL